MNARIHYTNCPILTTRPPRFSNALANCNPTLSKPLLSWHQTSPLLPPNLSSPCTRPLSSPRTKSPLSWHQTPLMAPNSPCPGTKPLLSSYQTSLLSSYQIPLSWHQTLLSSPQTPPFLVPNLSSPLTKTFPKPRPDLPNSPPARDPLPKRAQNQTFNKHPKLPHDHPPNPDPPKTKNPPEYSRRVKKNYLKKPLFVLIVN